jgi:hypothetical protein
MHIFGLSQLISGNKITTNIFVAVLFVIVKQKMDRQIKNNTTKKVEATWIHIDMK